ncbi:MAG: capsule assembly Wzi family protein [Agarilytica sp.]
MQGKVLNLAFTYLRQLLNAVRLLSLLFIALFIFSPSDNANAAPWIETGDERSRHHLQYLNDTGAINLPLTSWPVSWADINRELVDIHLDELDSKQLWSYRYLRHAREQDDRSIKTTKRFYGSNSINPFTHFASGSTEETYLNSETTLLHNHFALNIDVQAIRNPTNEDSTRFDGSYLATQIGNWTAGIGSFDRWWGPGWQSSLILSNNARPTEGVFIRRSQSLGVNLPLLSLLGPWSFKAFAGRLAGENSVPKDRLMGTRFTATPLSFLEISLSKILIRNGDLPELDGREETGDDENREDKSTTNTSYDFRLSLPSRSFSTAVYGQWLHNEDHATAKAESAKMAGFELGFSWAATHNRLALEIADTENSITTTETPSENPIYGLPSYLGGYRHHGRVIGESAGTNATKISALGDHYLDNGIQLSWRFSQLDINKNSESGNVFTPSPLAQEIAEISFKFPLSGFALVNAGGFYLSEDMMLVNRKLNSGAYLQLELRF